MVYPLPQAFLKVIFGFFQHFLIQISTFKLFLVVFEANFAVSLLFTAFLGPLLAFSLSQALLKLNFDFFQPFFGCSSVSGAF